MLSTIFSRCIHRPANITADDTAYLKLLSTQFPYCQLLHSFISRSAINQGNIFDESLSKAALYASDRTMLYTIINNPEDLIASAKTHTDLPKSITNPTTIAELPHSIDIKEDLITDANFQMLEENLDTHATSPNDIDSDIVTEELIDSEEEQHEVTQLDDHTPEKTDPAPVSFQASANQQSPDTLNQEKSTYQYDSQQVSKYDDDKMPFSFLWWLSKTRKEHAGTYQPYVKPNLPPKLVNRDVKDALNHQIVEHIFHQQASLDNISKGEKNSESITFKREQEAVLDTFIRTAPQIKPPKTDTISSENKARESAQDANDLVSETLAEIYTRQMLKFPEKSAYFTDLIRSLEKNK